MNVLVIAAHPDDEVLGCGGTIRRLANEGHAVSIAILGEGITSRFEQRESVNKNQIKQLHARSRKVAVLLGAKDVSLFSLPDNRFDTVPLLDVVKIIENLVEKLKPQVVYTQHGGDLNLDHAVTFRATLTATRPITGRSVRAVYAYEVASSTEWAFTQFSPPFKPNVFTDIGLTLDMKIQAMETYDSEVRKFPHPRSPEALRATAKRWGSVVGVTAAEAFQCVWEVQ
jgi:LmbE family N-acetylglucosaminyl deacetylase